MKELLKKVIVLSLVIAMFLQSSLVSFAEELSGDVVLEENIINSEEEVSNVIADTELEEEYTPEALEEAEDKEISESPEDEIQNEVSEISVSEESVTEEELIDLDTANNRKALEIIEQPSNAIGYVGETVNFHVKAQGENLSYQWYYSYDEGSSWRKCDSYIFYGDDGSQEKKDFVGAESNTLEMVACRRWMLYQIKCVITDGDGNTLDTNKVCIEPGKPVVTSQSDKQVDYNPNDTEELFVNAKGILLRYRWYESKDSGITWKKTFLEGYATNKLLLKDLDNKYDGGLFRCLITDKYGNEVTSDSIQVKFVKTSDSLFRILNQPNDAIGYEDEEASFFVEAQGTDLKYCWYYSYDNGKSWRQCTSYKMTDANGNSVQKNFEGGTSNTLSVTVTKRCMLFLYKCVITDINKDTLETDVVHITPGKPVVTKQSESTLKYRDSDKLELYVEVKGIDLRYRWYESKDLGTTWKKSFNDGYATSTLTLKDVNVNYDGYEYYCLITDKYGEEVKSGIISLKYEESTGNFIIYSGRNILDYNRTVLCEHDHLIENATFDENFASFNIAKSGLNSADVFLFTFSARAQKECLKVRVNINDGNGVYTGVYPVQIYEEDYIIPISGVNHIDTISIEILSEESIDAGNFELSNLGQVDIANYVTGIVAVNKTNTLVDINDSVGFMATDSAVYKNRLYTVYQGVLGAYDISNPDKPVVLGCLTGLGDTRDIAITDEGETLVIACRADGVNIVDVKDSTNMQLISNIDTLGLATGVAVNGEYCFVTARRHGLDVYDISKPESPVFCDQIFEGDEEFYDCCVSDGYLYVSSWAEKKVHVYSLKNIYDLKKVATISTDGNAAGCTVVNGKLFVATGYHSSGSRKTKTDMNYGMGNGFEIYDVENPSSPTWLSTSKIDGRFYISGLDHWRVVVSNNIAYVVNAYNGVYVYDVSNAAAPDRIEKIVVNIPRTSNKYKVTSNANYLFPYDQQDHAQSLVTSVTPIDGKIYITTHAGDMLKSYDDSLTRKTRRGLYVLNRDYAKTVNSSDCVVTGIKGNSLTKHISIGNYDGIIFPTEGNVRSIAYFADRYFLAEGVAGLYMYDSQTLQPTRVPEIGTAISLEVVGKYMYVSDAGVGIRAYKWSGNTLELVCEYRHATGGSISNIHASPDGKYLLAQRSLYDYLLLDITDKRAISLVKCVNAGGMYCRNITTDSTEDGIFGISSRNSLVFYKIGEDGTPELVAEASNPYVTENGGMTGYGEYVIQMAYKGYVYYKPAELNNGSSAIKRVIINNYTVNGTPKIIGNTMFVSDSLGKMITLIDISNIAKPKIISQVSVDGNPDEVYVNNGVIMIPLAHEGIIVLKGRE